MCRITALQAQQSDFRIEEFAPMRFYSRSCLYRVNTVPLLVVPLKILSDFPGIQSAESARRDPRAIPGCRFEVLSNIGVGARRNVTPRRTRAAGGTSH
jgi:hypothetical protein